MDDAGGGGGLVAVGVGAAEVKSPKSPNPLDMLWSGGLGGGGLVILPAAGLGLLSKKLPPLGILGDITDGCLVGTEGDARLENSAGFVVGCCGAADEEKLRLLKASSKPPEACIGTFVGD